MKPQLRTEVIIGLASLLLGCQLIGGFQEPDGGSSTGARPNGGDGPGFGGGASGNTGGTPVVAGGGGPSDPPVQPCDDFETTMTAPEDGAVLVRVPTAVPTQCFWVDEEEVTVARYTEFLATGTIDWDMLPNCAWKVGENPTDPRTVGDMCGSSIAEDQGDPFAPDKPIRCVDWCDAKAYCNWVGRRLCRGDTTNVGFILEPNSPVDEHEFACSPEGDKYPWGPKLQTDEDDGVTRCNLGQPDVTCITGSSVDCGPKPVSSHPNCTWDVGDGPHNMLGNVKEWSATCRKNEDPELDDQVDCHRRGASYATPLEGASCLLSNDVAPRADRSPDTGFRCCKDL